MSREARRKRRAALFQKQGGRCYYCTGEMRLLAVCGGQQPPDMATLEHIRQRVEGGTYGSDNTKAACASCNVMRPNGMDSDDYKALRQKLLPEWAPCSPPSGNIRRRVQREGPQDIYRIAHSNKQPDTNAPAP